MSTRSKVVAGVLLVCVCGFDGGAYGAKLSLAPKETRSRGLKRYVPYPRAAPRASKDKKRTPGEKVQSSAPSVASASVEKVVRAVRLRHSRDAVPGSRVETTKNLRVEELFSWNSLHKPLSQVSTPPELNGIPRKWMDALTAAVGERQAREEKVFGPKGSHYRVARVGSRYTEVEQELLKGSVGHVLAVDGDSFDVAFPGRLVMHSVPKADLSVLDYTPTPGDYTYPAGFSQENQFKAAAQAL